MLMRMKTTLILPDSLVRSLKRRAVERGTTLSQVVAEALRRGLQSEPKTILPALPVHALGVACVDIADRDALYQAMEGH